MEPSALKLVMVQGPRKGETLEFVPGSKVEIYRVVRDLDSSNRTVLNGSDIPPNTLVDLTDGEEIKIDKYTFVEVRIADYEESQLRRNPRRAATAAEVTAVPISESRGRRGRVAKESKEIADERMLRKLRSQGNEEGSDRSELGF
ncbi:hypothetical protein C1H46_043163 [Malus baccata]|uniref:FHA domain-containing protein n=1 Tax=Malus baccata TaxID=106549 RepID=A0A540KAQ4_MALBA|nr:hypothetical protein C1H46_043163 [Malus baccata]